MIGTMYFISPVIKLANNSGINPSYWVTGILLVTSILECSNGNMTIGKDQKKYFLYMQGIILCMILGAILSNNFLISDILHYIGTEQYILGVFLIGNWYEKREVNGSKCFKYTIIIVITANIIMGLIQMFSVKIGGILTKILFTYTGKDLQINDVLQVTKRFIRIMGTNYSPTVLGIISLLMIAYFVSQILNNKKVYFWYILALFLGLFAFSKSAILGTWIIILLGMLLEIFVKRKITNILIFKWLKCIGITLSTYIFVCIFASLIGLSAFVNYYYFESFNIRKAVSTRYGNILENTQTQEERIVPISDGESDSIISNKENSSEMSYENKNLEQTNDGNLIEAFEVFKEHPVFGVGPGSLRGEFVGDSQFIMVLHDGGISAFIIYGIFFGGLLVQKIKKKDIKNSLIICALGMGAFSLPVFILGCTIPFLGSVLSDD